MSDVRESYVDEHDDMVVDIKYERFTLSEHVQALMDELHIARKKYEDGRARFPEKEQDLFEQRKKEELRIVFEIEEAVNLLRKYVFI